MRYVAIMALPKPWKLSLSKKQGQIDVTTIHFGICRCLTDVSERAGFFPRPFGNTFDPLPRSQSGRLYFNEQFVVMEIVAFFRSLAVAHAHSEEEEEGLKYERPPP